MHDVTACLFAVHDGVDSAWKCPASSTDKAAMLPVIDSKYIYIFFEVHNRCYEMTVHDSGLWV